MQRIFPVVITVIFILLFSDCGDSEGGGGDESGYFTVYEGQLYFTAYDGSDIRFYVYTE